MTKEERTKETKLIVSNQHLESRLDLSDFINLEELNCYDNQLTQLNLPNPNQIKYIDVRNNYLTDLSFLGTLDSKKITHLYISNNNLSEQDLSIFSRFVNLEGLGISN